MPLLNSLSALETLEELRVDNSGEGNVDWGRAFSQHPQLASKPVELSVQDRDLDGWKHLELPALREGVLSDLMNQ